MIVICVDAPPKRDRFCRFCVARLLIKWIGRGSLKAANNRRAHALHPTVLWTLALARALLWKRPTHWVHTHTHKGEARLSLQAATLFGMVTMVTLGDNWVDGIPGKPHGRKGLPSRPRRLPSALPSPYAMHLGMLKECHFWSHSR